MGPPRSSSDTPDELNVTQAAVSRQIRLLEDHLGKPLFTRAHRSVELTPEALKSYDLVVLITDHTLYRYDEILKQAPLILDTRHKFPNHQKVVRG